MISMGGLSIGGIGPHKQLGVAAYVIAGLLIGGGASLFVRSRVSIFLALFAALVTAISGLAARFGHPDLALPIPWWLSVVVGLYLCIRMPLVKFPRKSQPRSSESTD